MRRSSRTISSNTNGLIVRPQDYYATIYAAEIVNAITNCLFLYLGVKGIRSCRKNGHDWIFQVAFLGYLVVGTGSFLFHSTLKCKDF